MISNPKNARGSRNTTTWLGIEFHLPRAFNSCAQPRIRSCTSSGATSVRCHASVHLGFAGTGSMAAVGLACFLAALESLLRKTREKNGIFAGMRLPLYELALCGGSTANLCALRRCFSFSCSWFCSAINNTLAWKASKANWTGAQKTDRIIKRQKRRRARGKNQAGMSCSPGTGSGEKRKGPLVRTAQSVREQRGRVQIGEHREI